MKYRIPQQRAAAVKAVLDAPEGYVCELKEPTRNSEQNAALHAMLSDIAKQVKWHGQSLSVEVWKRLTMAAYLRESGGNPLLVPSLDGHGVDIIYERTSQLSVKKCAELIQWVEVFGNEQGVRFTTNRGEQ